MVLVLLAVRVLSEWWGFGYRTPWGPGFSIGQGVLEIVYWFPPSDWSNFKHGWAFYSDNGASSFWWFDWRTRPDSWWLHIPIWVLSILAAVPAILAWRGDRRARRRELADHCPACGYDRRGISPVVACPECGKPSPGSSPSVPS